jgi:hypothetical protein
VVRSKSVSSGRAGVDDATMSCCWYEAGSWSPPGVGVSAIYDFKVEVVTSGNEDMQEIHDVWEFCARRRSPEPLELKGLALNDACLGGTPR